MLLWSVFPELNYKKKFLTIRMKTMSHCLKSFCQIMMSPSNFPRLVQKLFHNHLLYLSFCIGLRWGHVCFCIIIMVFCHLVCVDDTSSSKAGVPRGTPHLLRWRVINRALLSGEKKSPCTHLVQFSPPIYLARASKNNHSGHAPLLPIISLIYPHLSLTFSFPPPPSCFHLVSL